MNLKSYVPIEDKDKWRLKSIIHKRILLTYFILIHDIVNVEFD